MYQPSKRYRLPIHSGRQSTEINSSYMVVYSSSAMTEVIEVLESAEFVWAALNIHSIALSAFMTD